jgi:23S rRNA (uracil1939-C5)-methyltransferase
MARDLSYLTDMYDVKKVLPVDMFPKTNHTECITLLELKK